MQRRDFLTGLTSAAVLAGANPSSAAALDVIRRAATRTIPTIDDLHHLAGSPGEIVWLSGYHSLSDGGEGLFQWDEKATVSGNGGTIISPMSRHSGRWTRIKDGTFFNPKWFGAKGDGRTDDAEALIRLREAMRAEPNTHHRVVFPSGRYQYSNNRWLFGVNKVTVDAQGAQFQNISNSGWHADKRPFNTQSIWDEVGDAPEESPHLYTTGQRICDVAAGNRVIALLEDGIFKPGDRVLVHGFNQQDGDFPPNVRYFEWNEVDAIGGRVLTLKTALRHAFKAEEWPDYTFHSTMDVGKARILNLDRPNFKYPTNVEINEALFLPAENGGPDNLLIASDTLILRRVSTTGKVVPSENRIAYYEDCKFGIGEPDKICDRVTFLRCQFKGSITEATGVNSLTIEDCNIEGGVVRVAPRHGTIRRNRIFPRPGHEWGVIQNKEVWATETLVIEDNHVSHNGSLRHAINTGIDNFLMVEGVGKNNELLLPYTNSVDPIRRIRPGTLLYAEDLSGWGRITKIRNIGKHWAIDGDWKSPSRGVWKFNAIQRIRESGTTISGGDTPIFRDHRAPQLSEAGKGGIVHFRLGKGFRYSEGYERQQILGYVRSILVRILRPYAGPDAEAYLWVELNSGSINMTHVKVSLSQKIVAHVGGDGTFSDGKAITLRTLPLNKVTSEVTIYFRSGNNPLRGGVSQMPLVELEFDVQSI